MKKLGLPSGSVRPIAKAPAIRRPAGRSSAARRAFRSFPVDTIPVATTSARRASVNPSCLIQGRSEEHTSELQSQSNLVCRLLLEKKKKNNIHPLKSKY